MSSYYYVVASLPMLRFDEEPKISHKEFLSSCAHSLSAKDMSYIQEALEGNREPKGTLLRTYMTWKRKVDSQLLQERAKRLSLPADQYKNRLDKETIITETVRNAVQHESPLEGELLLMKLHWDKIVELCTGHFFDIEVLIAYALQLSLLQRKALFTYQEGNAECKRLFSNLQTTIKSM